VEIVQGIGEGFGKVGREEGKAEMVGEDVEGGWERGLG